MAKLALSNLKGNSYRVLEEQGIFRQPLKTSMMDEYYPWLHGEVQSELEQQRSSQAVLAALIQRTTQGLVAESRKAIQAHEDMLREKQLAKERRRQERAQRRLEEERRKAEELARSQEEPPHQEPVDKPA